VADPPMRQWPSVDGDKGHTAIDKERVKKLLAALVQDLKQYEGESTQGTPYGVSDALSQITAVSVGASGTGQTVQGQYGSSYPGGELMWRAVQSVNGSPVAGGGGATGEGFSGEYTNFVTQYSQVIDALYKAAGIQEDADTQSILQAGSGSGTTLPTTTNDGSSGNNGGSYDDGSQT
jgi:hypothetical protein